MRNPSNNQALRHRRIGALLVCGTTVAALLLAAYRYHISIPAAAGAIVDWVRHLGPWGFFVAMAILPALGFPLLPFALAAGPAFGPSLGAPTVALLAVLAVSANTAVSYVLARSLLHQTVTRLVSWLGYALPAIPQEAAWNATLAVRLAPGLPFCIQSYALGIGGVAWIPYIVISTLVPSVYLTGAVVCGASAWQGGVGAVVFGASLLVFAAVLSRLWLKRNRQQRHACAEAGS